MNTTRSRNESGTGLSDAGEVNVISVECAFGAWAMESRRGRAMIADRVANRVPARLDDQPWFATVERARYN